MNIQFARMSIFKCDGENLRLEPGAATHFARLARHERADAIASELALSFCIEPLHLGNESFKRAGRFAGTAVTAETHLDWLIAGPEVKRFLKLLGQFGKRHVFINMKMFHERALQVTVVCLHSLRPPPPWRDRPFGECLAGIGNHQLRIASQLRAKTVTCRTRSEMTVERKMFRSQLAEREPGFCVSVIGRIAEFFQKLARFGVGHWALDV